MTVKKKKMMTYGGKGKKYGVKKNAMDVSRKKYGKAMSTYNKTKPKKKMSYK